MKKVFLLMLLFVLPMLACAQTPEEQALERAERLAKKIEQMEGQTAAPAPHAVVPVEIVVEARIAGSEESVAATPVPYANESTSSGSAMSVQMPRSDGLRLPNLQPCAGTEPPSMFGHPSDTMTDEWLACQPFDGATGHVLILSADVAIPPPTTWHMMSRLAKIDYILAEMKSRNIPTYQDYQ